MTQIILDDEFEELWMNKLTEKQRKNRAIAALKITRDVAEKQIDLIKDFIKNKKPDTLSFKYFYETVKSIWEHVDFALSLGRGKNRRFAFYPARTVFENTFRLEYFSSQKSELQEEIAIKECLRISKRHYDHEVINDNIAAAQEFKNYYNKFSQGRYADIEIVKLEDLEPFPSMRKLTTNSKISGAGAWYFHYQALAEESHGKLMSLVMIRQSELWTYRLSLMYLLMMANDVLKNTDFHLGGATHTEVVNAIQKAESIVKRSI